MGKLTIKIYLMLAVGLMLGSCKKWVEVSPKKEIREEEFFTSEVAFKEALNGVYYSMGSREMYGSEMTWGLVDVLGDMYSIEAASVSTTYPEYVSAYRRDFNASVVAGKIKNIWGETYKCIANLNNLIKNLENADKSIFPTTEAKNQMLGEAVGLRAFLHFDILRLFAPLPNSAAGKLPAIPYVESYSTNIKPLISVTEVIKKVQADLSRSEQLLATDPIMNTQPASSATIISRKIKFNYYAVKALQARVHLWNGDKEQALLASRAVINASSTRFPWVNINRVTVSPLDRDRIFSTELVFSLVIDKIQDHTRGLLNNVYEPRVGETIYRNMFIAPSPEKRDEIFENQTVGSTDVRNLYLLEREEYSGNPNNQFTLVYSKLKPALYGSDSTSYRMPMFRVSEMYYIAAECLVDTEPITAIEFLNNVRLSRGISINLPSNLSSAQIREEIRKEYQKEFTCEGQMLFCRKRMAETDLVLPLPLAELEGR